MKRISNPLTIIGIFAGITEVGGSIILPLLGESSEVQKIYVYFLVSFPVVLLFLFFGTLWFKHKVLYGPGDFDNETIAKMFLNQDKVSIKEDMDKVNEELAEVNRSPIVATGGNEGELIKGPTEMTDVRGEKLDEINSKVLYNQFKGIEQKAISYVENKLNISARREVAINVGNKRVLLDALAEQKDTDIAIEVKWFRGNGNAFYGIIARIFREYESINTFYKIVNGKSFAGIIVLVFNENSKNQKDRVLEYVNSQIPRYKVTIKVICVSETDISQMPHK